MYVRVYVYVCTLICTYVDMLNLRDLYTRFTKILFLALILLAYCPQNQLSHCSKSSRRIWHINFERPVKI